MKIHLTNEQPPKLQVTCDSGDEFRALYTAVDVFHRHTENLELSSLEPSPSSEMVEGLQQNMGTTTRNEESGEVAFNTGLGQQKTLRAAASLALNTLETRLDAETGLLAGSGSSETPMQVNVRLSGLTAGIRAWQSREAVFTATARPLATASPV